MEVIIYSFSLKAGWSSSPRDFLKLGQVGQVSGETGPLRTQKPQKGSTSESSFRLFIAKIGEADNDGYEVQFLKRHSQTTKFVYTDEESYIKQSDIVRKLSQPLKSKSARYANMVYFSTDLTDLLNLIN